jgi:predicted secreted protein
MAVKLGNDYRLWIESATPGAYNLIAGQQDLSINRQGQTIDISSKNDFPYAAQAAGARTLSISLSGVADLPDATGFTRLETEANTTIATPFNVQIRSNGSSGADPADTVFEGSVYATDFNTSMGRNDAVKYSVTLVAAAAPTTDVLA